jgi:hypothetical protein
MVEEVDLTYEQALRHAEKWCDAFNRRDLEAVLDLYADEIHIVSSPLERMLPGSGVVVSRQVFRERLIVALEHYTMIIAEFDVLPVRRSYYLYCQLDTGAMATEFIELDKDGKVIIMVTGVPEVKH